MVSDQDDWAAGDTAEAAVPEQPTAGPVDQDVMRRRSAGRVQARPTRTLTRRPAERSAGRSGQTHFAAVDQWVTGWLLPMWSRDLHGEASTWCPQWWRHPEAVARLTALWLAWEHLRLDPATGMSAWWRDHADHHLAVLLSSSTVFKGCSPKGHTDYPLPQLPSDPTPEGLFDT